MIVSHLHPTSCTAKIELVGRVVLFVFMFKMIIACIFGIMIPCQSSSDILWLHLLYEQISYCIACVYNPPRPRYQPQALTDAIVTGLDSFLATNCNSGIGSTILTLGLSPLRHLLPAIPTDKIMLADQFGFRPSGSTQCALTNMIHHVTTMLENCDFVRCLMIDFSRAFDVVDHSVLLAKLSQLNLPECIQNWIVSFLVGRSFVFL